jgi:hypothetical protein
MPAKMTKHVLITIASIIFGIISGSIGALVSSPFWGWFESTSGIESLGHGGPDDWVFEFLIGVTITAIFAILEFTFRERKTLAAPPDEPETPSTLDLPPTN